MRRATLHAVAFGLVVGTTIHAVTIALIVSPWAWVGVTSLVACAFALLWTASPERDGEDHA
jgi:hypothetical protein